MRCTNGLITMVAADPSDGAYDDKVYLREPDDTQWFRLPGGSARNVAVWHLDEALLPLPRDRLAEGSRAAATQPG